MDRPAPAPRKKPSARQGRLSRLPGHARVARCWPAEAPSASGWAPAPRRRPSIAPRASPEGQVSSPPRSRSVRSGEHRRRLLSLEAIARPTVAMLRRPQVAHPPRHLRGRVGGGRRGRRRSVRAAGLHSGLPPSAFDRGGPSPRSSKRFGALGEARVPRHTGAISAASLSDFVPAEGARLCYRLFSDLRVACAGAHVPSAREPRRGPLRSYGLPELPVGADQPRTPSPRPRRVAWLGCRDRPRARVLRKRCRSVFARKLPDLQLSAG